MTTTVDAAPAGVAPATAEPRRPGNWLPAIAVVVATVWALLATGTTVWDIVRYTGYLAYAVVGPGVLIYRAMRRKAHTLLEDITFGAAIGLAVELGAWALWSLAGQQRLLWTWPLVVYAVFLAVPRWRGNLRASYTRVPGWFAWVLAAVCVGFIAYLYVSFLKTTAILPAAETTRVYIDLPFQLSLAGELKHHFPPHVPQVSFEPLHYHWFGFAHMGAASLISGVDLPVVFFRLAVPVLCLAAIAGMAVAGWRISGRPAVGVVAAALTFTIGEFNFTDPVTLPLGTISTFIVWGSPSMTYSWVLLIPLVALVADRVARNPDNDSVPELGRGAWIGIALLVLASTGAKASSVPVILGALGLLLVWQLVHRRRVTRAVLFAFAGVLVAQVFANAILFAFETHGTKLLPFWGMRRFFPDDGGFLAILGIAVAFLANMLLRLAGLPVLLRLRRGIRDIDIYLVGGALAGIGAYLVFGHPGDSNQYFVRAGWVFGAIASAWGWTLLAERCRLSDKARAGLAAAALAFSGALLLIQFWYALPNEPRTAFDPLVPTLVWLAILGAFGALMAVGWFIVRRGRPSLRGVGAVALLTGILLAGIPGLAMDAAKAEANPNGGAYVAVTLAKSRVDAARWVRDHSDPDDVLATNVHCLAKPSGYCDSRSFWLSGYAERRVFIEGWIFAPRATTIAAYNIGVYIPFGDVWDQALYDLNESAFTAPTAAGLAELRDRHGVRWLVVDRDEAPEAPALASLATKAYDNGRLAVYQLRD